MGEHGQTANGYTEAIALLHIHYLWTNLQESWDPMSPSLFHGRVLIGPVLCEPWESTKQESTAVPRGKSSTPSPLPPLGLTCSTPCVPHTLYFWGQPSNVPYASRFLHDGYLSCWTQMSFVWGTHLLRALILHWKILIAWEMMPDVQGWVPSGSTSRVADTELSFSTRACGSAVPLFSVLGSVAPRLLYLLPL